MNIQQVISKAKKNNQVAFRTLFDTYKTSMFTTSFRITNNKEESKDIIQECFLKSFQKLENLKDAHHYAGWLRRMVINASLKYIKSRKISFEILDSDVEAINEDEWYKNVSWQKLKEEIQNLSDGCRTVFTLYALENHKHREIAEILNINISTSKSQYKYACKVLKSKLTKYIDHGI